MSEKLTTKILVLVPNYWGKGETAAEAWRNVRRAGGPSKRDSKGRYVIYRVHPDTVCEEIHGNLQYPKGAPKPVAIEIGPGVTREERDGINQE